MKIELMKRYTFKQFKKEFYKQHPDGTQSELFYYWNTYQANKVTKK